MNVLWQLTLRNLKLNRKRTIVTIIGIILSGAMICGVATLVASFQDALIRTAHITDGSHHAVLHDVRRDSLRYIAEHANTDEYMLFRHIGVAHLEGSHNPNKPYLRIEAFDAAAFEHLPVRLTEGRFPQQAGEIVVSEDVFYNGGVEIRVGDQLQLAIGRRTDQGAILLDEALSPSETLDIQMTETYTVTGMIKQPNLYSYRFPGYTAIIYLDENVLAAEDLVNAAITAKQPRKIYDTAAALAEVSEARKVSYNNELLRWMGISNNEVIKDLFITVGAILILLIMVGSISVIYNAFAISVSERKKQFGMLLSVGAASRQIRRMVFMEAFALALIGIPLGILSGIAGIDVTLEVINQLSEGMIHSSGDVFLRLIVMPETVIISIIIMALTIFLSAYIPAQRAARISPIDAIRLTTDINIKGKKLRTSRLSRWLFGIEGELALKNLKRHRKRYRTTVFSLFISIVLYLSISSFMNLGFESTALYYSDLGYEMALLQDEVEPEEQREFHQQVAAMDGVSRFASVRLLYVRLIDGVDESILASDLRDEILGSSDAETQSLIYDDAHDQNQLHAYIVSMGKQPFRDYAEQLGLDLAAYQDPDAPRGILFNRSKIQYPVLKEFQPLNITAGHRFTIREEPLSGEPMEDDRTDDLMELDLEIGMVTDKQPYAVQPGGLGHVTIVVSDEVYDHLLSQIHESDQKLAAQATMYLDLDEGVERSLWVKEVEALAARINPGSYLSVLDFIEINENTKRSNTIIAIFLYGFVSLIALIGVTNIFNTISTNVALRRREFAMLKSIGMTPQGFNRMLNYECLFYGIKALLYGLPVGILISIMMYRSISTAFSFNYAIPWLEVGICVAAVFIIVFLTMLHASSKLKKENIIDALKLEIQ